ncbi:group II intron reverse transcriptase/maturase [Butyricimonas synergistica]|uniref:group II intron reverse transcriptase/maturase n=1 Tax=Butyricimonas synergistica TaxID=544644 RepID=UPI0022E7474A|nr:group II intron reverse transcriptase/maturase [Butyricimonas synergistica]
MKEGMQKISTRSDNCPRRVRTESKYNVGVQTFMGITENNLVEVHFEKEDLLERIVSPSNMNLAYKQVVSNGGKGGVDSMSTEELLPYLRLHKDELLSSLVEGSYRPNPVRRVEIPKDGGKKRVLGIPTVVDRLVQQSISQVLIPLYEQQFEDNSFGFRPRRGTHQALHKAVAYLNDGHVYCVNFDLEKFFDTVSHSTLINILSRAIKDSRVISLIHKYLNAGVVVTGKYESSTSGVPQGGPLSPLLSNIMLNEMDKELSRRGHLYVRYADDCLIFCKSHRAAERIQKSMTKFIEETLHLKVNQDKTVAGSVRGIKYLGYSFYRRKGEWRLTLHPTTEVKLRSRLREITSRSNGFGYSKRKEELRLYLRGWVAYYHLADMRSRLSRLDQWLRRRIRLCIWKSWKNPKTRIRNLIKCGVPSWQARRHGWNRGLWCIASSPDLNHAMSNEKLRLAGYTCLMDCYKMYRS